MPKNARSKLYLNCFMHCQATRSFKTKFTLCVYNNCLYSPPPLVSFTLNSKLILWPIISTCVCLHILLAVLWPLDLINSWRYIHIIEGITDIIDKYIVDNFLISKNELWPSLETVFLLVYWLLLVKKRPGWNRCTASAGMYRPRANNGELHADRPRHVLLNRRGWTVRCEQTLTIRGR